MGTWVFRIISRGFSPDKWVVVPYYGQKKSKVRFLSHVWEKAGRVGFEPTICVLSISLDCCIEYGTIRYDISIWYHRSPHP